MRRRRLGSVLVTPNPRSPPSATAAPSSSSVEGTTSADAVNGVGFAAVGGRPTSGSASRLLTRLTLPGPGVTFRGIARILAGTARRLPGRVGVRAIRANGDPGRLLLADGEPFGVMALDFDADTERIAAVYVVTSPDKLTRVPRG
jgi:hypothetical protein